MADYFLDTSSLAKRYVAEVGSAWVMGLSDLAAGNTCWLAAITRVELLAALYRRARTGALSQTEAQQAALVFRHELHTHFRSIPLDGVILDRAMDLVAAYPLRAYDAVQLATAIYLKDQHLAVGLPAPVFIGADQDLNQAALAEGLPVDDPNLHP